MIGIKAFHLFFIALSILLTGWYSYFEITTPTNPGNISIILSTASFLSMLGLSIYGYNFFNKLKDIK